MEIRITAYAKVMSESAARDMIQHIKNVYPEIQQIEYSEFKGNVITIELGSKAKNFQCDN